MKIIKTHAATASAGNGVGAHKACWAVKGRPDICIRREFHFWIAFFDGRKRFVAESRAELEAMLAGGAA